MNLFKRKAPEEPNLSNKKPAVIDPLAAPPLPVALTHTEVELEKSAIYKNIMLFFYDMQEILAKEQRSGLITRGFIAEKGKNNYAYIQSLLDDRNMFNDLYLKHMDIEYNIPVTTNDLDNFISTYGKNQDIITFIIKGFPQVETSKYAFYRQENQKKPDYASKTVLSYILSANSYMKPLPVFKITDPSLINDIEQSGVTKAKIVSDIENDGIIEYNEIEIVKDPSARLYELDVLTEKPSVVTLRDEISATTIKEDNVKIQDYLRNGGELSTADIPIYFVVTTGSYGGHATLLILKDGKIYSVGLGYDGAGLSNTSPQTEQTEGTNGSFGNGVLLTPDFILSLKEMSKNNIIDIGVFTEEIAERLNIYVSGAKSISTTFKPSVNTNNSINAVANELSNITIARKPLMYSYLSNQSLVGMKYVNCTSWVLEMIGSNRISCTDYTTAYFADPSKCVRIPGKKLTTTDIERINSILTNTQTLPGDINELLKLLQYPQIMGGGGRGRKKTIKRGKVTRKRSKTRTSKKKPKTRRRRNKSKRNTKTKIRIRVQ